MIRSVHINLLIAPFLVVVASAADDLQPGRWLSRRDFIFDTTNSNGNNMRPEIEGSELEFGDLRKVHRKDNRAGNVKEVKRKRKRKLNNHAQHGHKGHHYNNNHFENEQKRTHLDDMHINDINIDVDFMGHVLRRRSEPKSLDYQGSKKNPTRIPTKKPDGRTNNNFPTVSATQIPVAYVVDDNIKEECSPNSICYQEGTVCSSGQEDCCGVIHASLECECADVGDENLQYMCFHTEACMSPCEEKAVTREVDTYNPSWTPTTGTTSNNKHSKPTVCPINLGKSESLLDDLTLHYEVVGGNLCIRLEYENEGWLGLGFSSSDGNMVGSTAVIGLPDVKEGKSNPAYYALDGMVDSMITPLPESQQTLQDPKISQENGLTVMSFAKSLDDEHISMGENTFIFAAANFNQFGYHNKRGAVTLYLSP